MHRIRLSILLAGVAFLAVAGPSLGADPTPDAATDREPRAHSTPLPAPSRAVDVPPAVYATYAGRYDVATGGTLTVTNDGGVLHAVATGYRRAELIPVSVTEFVWFDPDSKANARLAFITGPSGRIKAVYRRDGTELWMARKVQ